jgi:hypothetical protein
MTSEKLSNLSPPEQPDKRAVPLIPGQTDLSPLVLPSTPLLLLEQKPPLKLCLNAQTLCLSFISIITESQLPIQYCKVKPNI